MFVEEMSDMLDVLYNNIASNAAPGLNEYEKSVLLTKAEYELVKNYFNPNGNKYREGFDDSAKRQIDFSMLMQTSTLTKGSGKGFDYRSTIYKMPSNVLVIVHEQVLLKSGSTVKGIRQVIPISYDEYIRLMSKPYKEPLKNQAWRLITGQSDLQAEAELILNSNDRSLTPEYYIRYVRRPKPIIVADLEETVGAVSIDGISAKTECELDPSIHQEIVQRAVELAKAAYSSDQSGQAQMQNQITIGQRSE